ncbi:MAG: cation transporter [Bacteroidota bacterium]|nr:cation transporter [Bacteroidota bacterium]
MNLSSKIPLSRNHLFKWALGFALFTVIYNAAEGIISTIFGAEDGSLTLFGFGADSFIEMISGIGIAHMVLRIQHNEKSHRDDFERTALRITGFSFYLLTAGLVLTSLYNIFTGHNPQTTLAGVVISLISILVMWALVYGKQKVGRALNSEAILADAACSRVCIYMSLILLLSSGLYALMHIPYIDSLGTLGLSYFGYKEGRECFEKSRSDKICGCK